jgi:hypothetical protein
MLLAIVAALAVVLGVLIHMTWQEFKEFYDD